MKVISIDASTKSTGVAVFDNETLIYYDCITASSTDVIKRIEKISNRLNEILDYFKPEKLILEEVRPENQYGAGNIQTHRVLMWLQAEINFLCHKKTPIIEVDYIYPNEWRSYIGIHTGAGVRRDILKKRDIEFVKKKFNIDVNDDVADAIGIFCGYTEKKKSKNGRPKGAF